MAGQQHQRAHRGREQEGESLLELSTDAQNPAADAQFDAVLDQIDTVLAGNAEEFVRGFVQKGGQ